MWRFKVELGTPGLIAAGALAFVAIAKSHTVTGEHMEKPHRIGQLYGYTVCLVSIVTFLTSMNSLVKSVLAFASPITYSEGPFRMGFEPSLSSFEAFRATYMFGTGGAVVSLGGGSGVGPDTTKTVDTLATADLRSRYEALRSERVAQVRGGATSQLISSIMLVFLAIVLFTLHWRWLRTREQDSGSSAAPA